MAKRVLMVATVAATIGSFNMNNIRILQDLGYDVDVAADFTDVSVWSEERLSGFKKQLSDMSVNAIQLDFSRNPLKFEKHIDSYREAVRLLKDKQYSFIHTHTPISSAIMRLAAHKTSTKVIYTAHGFHFYDGAPLKNWIVFYPVEKFLSKWTDVLITITKEDYKRASKHFNAKNTVYIPGVGVDIEKFKPDENRRDKIRNELSIPVDRILLVSVGELNENKNHERVIRAISGLKNITYVIVGKGDRKLKLEEVAAECGVDLRLPGFRTDVVDFYNAADIYILPSIREGLNVSLMEAMACGLPCCVGRIRGNVDLVNDCLFTPIDERQIRDAISKAIEKKVELGQKNLHKIQNFSVKNVNDLMRKIYK